MNTKSNSNRIYPFGGNLTICNGSHMPLDTSVRGWTWRNPLNILPLVILGLVILALIQLLLA